MTSVCIAHGGDLSDPSGGTDRVSAIANGLVERGFDVTLVAPEPDGALPDRLQSVPIHHVSTGGIGGAPRRAWRVARSAQRIAAQNDARLQLEHSTFAGIATLSGASGYVLDMHDLGYARFDHVDTRTAPLLRFGVARLERRAVSRADHVVAVSEYMAETLTDRWGVDPESVTVIPNGFFPETLSITTETDVVDGRVCFLGTLHPKVDVGAIERICHLPATEEVYVIGDGALREELSSLADDVDALHVTGRLPDEEAFPLLASAAVAINPQHPSDLQRSSSPVKLYYYAAMGKPMVVSEGPPVVDELVHAEAAIATDGREAFVEGVERVLEDEQLASDLSVNASSAADRFAWDSRVEALGAIHE